MIICINNVMLSRYLLVRGRPGPEGRCSGIRGLVPALYSMEQVSANMPVGPSHRENRNNTTVYENIRYGKGSTISFMDMV